MRVHQRLIVAACSVLFFGTSIAAVPRPSVPKAVDLGATDVVEGSSSMTLTIALKLRNKEQMEALVQALHTPNSPQFEQFLTTAQFAAQFGPTDATVAAVTRHYQARGFTVVRSATAQLQVTGSVTAVEREFGVQLHSYQVSAGAGSPAMRFRAPDRVATLDDAVSGSVEGLLGLDTRPRFRPNIAFAPQLKPVHGKASPPSGAAPNTPDVPGEWTVVDFAQYYNAEPLYDRGITGRGQTLGIVTFAAFTPSDALAYWHSLGLNSSGKRIRQVFVDGGSGPPSDAAGSTETTLDVEQSGGVAPGATVVVYQAPNSEQGAIDNFAKAVDQNVADTVSVSWGDWEWLDTVAADDVTNPVTGRNTTYMRALSNVLIQAALQGQSFFCSSGDAGAYDANDPALGLFDVPQYPKVLSVDDPAAQTYITAAGGTTLPGPQLFGLPDGSTYTVDIATEQAWGWDYLTPLCALLGFDPVSCGIFPAGGGGGVSSYVPIPLYQLFVPGMSRTPFGQNLTGPSYPQFGLQLPVNLPGGYAGRNVPDLSVNSDPDTGYVIWYTSSAPGSALGVLDFIGGTSFAAPQLNGMTALFNQALHHRVGVLNFALYGIASTGFAAYAGPYAPLRDIRAGDNWYWHAGPGYDQATGVGVPNIANLLQALEFH
ncbi:MAG TPA: S53 family peptidase [Steroidobacteraceae bacterium]|nr:S53 family peptidase [Steroidobacteraceae bacterium]